MTARFIWGATCFFVLCVGSKGENLNYTNCSSNTEKRSCLHCLPRYSSDPEWWIGKIILLALTLVFQKMPSFIMRNLFAIARNHAKRALKKSRKAHLARGGTGEPPPPSRKSRCCTRFLTAVAWFFFAFVIVGSFTVTIVLSARGTMESNLANDDGGNGTAPCILRHCSGVSLASSEDDVRVEWLMMIASFMLLRAFFIRPFTVFIATWCHLSSWSCTIYSNETNDAGTDRGKMRWAQLRAHQLRGRKPKRASRFFFGSVRLRALS